MIYFARGSLDDNLSPADLEQGLKTAFERLGARKRVVLVPPDITRLHSRAGEMACCAWRHYGQRISDVLPALGTHTPMTPAQIDRMYPGIPHDLFRVHDWREGVETLGRVPADYVREVSEGA
ncbi:MAG: D-mannonate epimerase, partial [Lentisphaerae bacterium]|nr:D-mannonate epimerase [Lentisphaerota bacterium]